ncbi:MAG: hypothetical protein FWD58_09965 [Firmicutes bacterium]|nr:hypothetical protein [Bacillota bacterium]
MKLKNKLLSALIVAVMAAAVAFTVAGCDGFSFGGGNNTNYSASTTQKVASMVDDTIAQYLAAGGYSSLDELFADIEVPSYVKEDVTKAIKSLNASIIAAMKRAGITDAEANKLLSLSYELPFDPEELSDLDGDAVVGVLLDWALSVDPITDLKNTGVSPQKISKFVYAMATETRKVLAGISKDTYDALGIPRAEVLKQYDDLLGVATEAEFVKVFSAAIESSYSSYYIAKSLFGPNGIVTLAEYTAVGYKYVEIPDPEFPFWPDYDYVPYEYTTFGPQINEDLTLNEFRTLAKTNLNELKKASELYSDDVVNAGISIIKKVYRLSMPQEYFSTSIERNRALNQINAMLDASAALTKAGRKITSAVLNAAANDNNLLEVFYKIYQRVADGELSSADSVILQTVKPDFVIGGMKLLAVAQDTAGGNLNNVRDLLANLYTATEDTSTAREIKAYDFGIYKAEINSYKSTAYGSKKTFGEDTLASDLGMLFDEMFSYNEYPYDDWDW